MQTLGSQLILNMIGNELENHVAQCVISHWLNRTFNQCSSHPTRHGSINSEYDSSITFCGRSLRSTGLLPSLMGPFYWFAQPSSEFSLKKEWRLPKHIWIGFLKKKNQKTNRGGWFHECCKLNANITFCILLVIFNNSYNTCRKTKLHARTNSSMNITQMVNSWNAKK